MRISSDGYTIMELLISISVLAIMFLIVSDFYADELISYNRNFSKTILQSNIKQAIETVERDVREASRVEDNNVWTDPNKPGGWQASSTTLVFAKPVINFSNSVVYADPTHTSIKTNDVVYFVGADNALYRRLIANPIRSNSERTTCPAALATPSCPPDGKVVENIASVSALYFDTTNNTIAGAPFNGAYSVQITMVQSLTAFGKVYTDSLTSQASMRNR